MAALESDELAALQVRRRNNEPDEKNYAVHFFEVMNFLEPVSELKILVQRNNTSVLLPR